jgi:5-methyltetrahydropteroyltriglutamate--homocysteine methyltransferase
VTVEARSEVIGSLLRPARLTTARERLDRGEMTPAEFKQVEDACVDSAIELQERSGVDVITDGEMRRYAFYGHLIDSLEGFDKEGGWGIAFRDESGEELTLPRPVVVEKLRWKRSMCAEEWTYFRARTGHPGKTTMLSVQQAAAYYDPKKSSGAYPSRDAYLADVVDVSRREIAELARLGCTYVQIDAPQYAALLDPKLREGFRERGADPDRLLASSIEMDNAVIADHPGMTFGIHICRGNNQSKFYAEGGYEPIAQVLTGTKFDRFLLEYDDQRSGGFEVLKRVPQDRVVVLGLVTTKKPRLESKEELLGRIREAARYIDEERLALSPQCGFASTWQGNKVTEEDQRKKLELVAETAREAWSAVRR